MLEVYSSSAGSGKTYTLTREYLRLALENPGFEGFEQLLAITFTKKATGELKDRILEELFRISLGESSMEDLLPYQDKARQMLSAILHEYSGFRVSTIDSFFSEIIRGFAREQKLSTGFTLEIDTDAVLQEALERLYQRIGAEPELTLLVSEWVMERVREGDSWDIRRQLSAFAGHGFNDTYRLLRRQTVQADEDIDESFLDRSRYLREEMKRIEQGLFDLAEPALALLGPDPDFTPFYQKARGPVAWLHSLTQRDPDSIRQPNTYTREVAEGRSILGKNQFFSGSPELERIVTNLVEYADVNLQRYYSLKAVAENLVSTYLLGHIMNEVQQVKQERNIFLVADLGYFLSRITEENDAPFIYERIGAHIRHYLIDEMQDTSGVQWDALRPLVDNAISGMEGEKDFEKGTSLVVGDIKQAIYRWRNGDWKLLLSKIRDDIGAERIRQKNLNTNYRSLERVVGFNNRAFQKLPEKVAEALVTKKLKEELTPAQRDVLDRHLRLIGMAYQGAEQKTGRQEFGAWDGFVDIGFLKDPEPQVSPEGELLPPMDSEAMLEKVTIDRLVDLQDRGFRAGNICVLVRKHDEGQKVGAWLQQAQEEYALKLSATGHPYDFRFTSADTLVISAASVVRLLVHLMGLLKDGDDRISMACVLHEYYVYVRGEAPPDLNEVFGLGEGHPEDFKDFFFESMPEGFREKMQELAYLPVHEVAEELVEFFGLHEVENESAYLMAFLDQTLAYQQNHRLDVKSFLDYYEEKGRREKLALADDGRAIRIMTVHKAKGLEFDAVVMPFCNWGLDHGSHGETLIWEQVQDMPGIQWAALKYKSGLIQTDFATHYLNEKVAAHLENLNLLYVAFTRASQELHVICPKRKAPNVGEVLRLWLEDEANSLEADPYRMDRTDTPALLSFRSGQPAVRKPEKAHKAESKSGIAHRLGAPVEAPFQFTYTSWRKRHLYMETYAARFEVPEPESRGASSAKMLVKLMLSATNLGASPQTLAELKFRGSVDEGQLDRLKNTVADLVVDPDLILFYDSSFAWRERPMLAAPDGQCAQPGRMGIKVDKKGVKVVRLACFHLDPEMETLHREDMQKIKQIAKAAGFKTEACAVIYLPQNRVIRMD